MYNHNDFSNEIPGLSTGLRDIADVLFDGKYTIVNNDLINLNYTIIKKINQLRCCSKREKSYKLQKIMGILNSSRKIVEKICIEDKEVVLLLLEELYLLCKELLKEEEI